MTDPTTTPTKKKRFPWLPVIFSLMGILVFIGSAIGVYFLVKDNLPILEDTDPTDDTDLDGDALLSDVEVVVSKARSCEDLNALAIKYFGEPVRESETDGAGDDDCEGCGDEDPGWGDDGYSITNVQVEGVDEDDSVKNDGTYIYFANNYDGIIYISKADPATSLDVVSKIDSEYAYFRSLYIHGDLLIGIGGADYYSGKYTESRWYGSTVMEVWDVSNKEDPEFVKGWMFEGYGSGSRLIDGDLYMVINTSRYYYTEDGLDIPEYRAYGEDEQAVCECTDVLIPDEAWSGNFVEIVGLDLDDIDGGIKTEVVYGIGDTIYMSKEHLYLAGTYYDYAYASSTDLWGKLKELVIPTVTTIEKTIISKLEFDSGEVEYLANGQVPGSLLDQFAMDEYNEHLRVATTRNRWTSKPTSNAVYILDDEMNRAGSVTGLAKGESIYAVRFIQEKGYIVTFEQIDPLFVLDLSDPSSPAVLGELKIPGYSDYIHPWGENYLIGFGMSTSGREGWVETDGVKIGLFDVSDPSDPREVSSIEIGGQGSNSEVLYNHRALLVNSAKGWFAIPVYEYSREGGVIEYGPGDTPKWNTTEFQGLYIFTVNTTTGRIELKGKVTHHEEGDFDSCHSYEYDGGSCWNKRHYERDIIRGLYIGNNVYAVSSESIGAYRWSDLSEIAKKAFGIELYTYEDYTED